MAAAAAASQANSTSQESTFNSGTSGMDENYYFIWIDYKFTLNCLIIHQLALLLNCLGGGQDHDIMSPAVIKKEHDYLGLFEYNMNHEAEIMRALIYGKLQSFIYSKPFPRVFWNNKKNGI